MTVVVVGNLHKCILLYNLKKKSVIMEECQKWIQIGKDDFGIQLYTLDNFCIKKVKLLKVKFGSKAFHSRPINLI